MRDHYTTDFASLKDARIARLATFKSCGWRFSQVNFRELSNGCYQVIGHSCESRYPLTLCNDGMYR